MKTLLLAPQAVVVIASLSLDAGGWLGYSQQAETQTQTEHKMILLDFTGIEPLKETR